jgi:hypothetical protein
MSQTLTENQIGEAKSRIFQNLAHAIQSTDNEDYFGVILRAEEVLNVAKQLRDAYLEKHGVLQ